MVVSDKMLFNLLAFIGVFNDHSKIHIKFFVILLILFYYVSAIYRVIFTIPFIAYKPVEQVGNLFLYILPMLVWFLLFIRRKKIHAVIHKVYVYRRKYTIAEKSSTLFQKISIIFLSLIIFIVYQLLYHFENKFILEFFLKLWALGMKLPNKNLKFAFVILMNLVNFIVTTFPVLMTVIISVMLHKFGETLNLYKKSLKFHLRNTRQCENKEILLD